MSVLGLRQTPMLANSTSASHPTPDVNAAKADIAVLMSVVEGKAEVVSEPLHDPV